MLEETFVFGGKYRVAQVRRNVLITDHALLLALAVVMLVMSCGSSSYMGRSLLSPSEMMRLMLPFDELDGEGFLIEVGIGAGEDVDGFGTVRRVVAHGVVAVLVVAGVAQHSRDIGCR